VNVAMFRPTKSSAQPPELTCIEDDRCDYARQESSG
jgi:hypothetical protein